MSALVDAKADIGSLISDLKKADLESSSETSGVTETSTTPSSSNTHDKAMTAAEGINKSSNSSEVIVSTGAGTDTGDNAPIPVPEPVGKPVPRNAAVEPPARVNVYCLPTKPRKRTDAEIFGVPNRKSHGLNCPCCE